MKPSISSSFGRYLLIFVLPFAVSLFYLHSAGILFPGVLISDHPPETLKPPGIAIAPQKLIGLTLFGRNQTGFVLISGELNDRIESEVKNNEKLLEKLFSPFLWYRFDLKNNLIIASTSPAQISPSPVNIKCTPTHGDSIDVPYGLQGSFISKLSSINKLKYGCAISSIGGEEWPRLDREKELLVDFAGTLELNFKPILISQAIVSILFYFIIAIPSAVLVKKSVQESANFVRGLSKGSGRVGRRSMRHPKTPPGD